MKSSRKWSLAGCAAALVVPLLVVGASAPGQAVPADDGRDDLYVMYLNNGGVVSVNGLDASSMFQTWTSGTYTSLPASAPGEWTYKLADYNGDRQSDLYAIDKDDNGYTSVSILNGADNFTTDLLDVTLPLGATTAWNWQFDVADYNGDGHADIYLINKDNPVAGGNHTAVYIYDANTWFQSFLTAVNTPLGVANDPMWQFDVADFNNDRHADLYAIYKDDGGHTAVHVLDATSGFQTYTMHTLTPLGAVHDPGWQLDVGDYNNDGRGDLYAMYRNDQGRTAVHVLNAASNFQVWSLHVLSALGVTTDPNWDLEVSLSGTGAPDTAAPPGNPRIIPGDTGGSTTPSYHLDPGDHKNKKAVDTDMVQYKGWDASVGGYHYQVNGHWLAVCGSSLRQYCWPASNFVGSGADYNIGSNDAAYILFSLAVKWKKFRVRTWDACGELQYDKSTSVDTSEVDSFTQAYAGVNDEKFPGYTVVTGTGASSSGDCKVATEPQSGMCAGGGGGGSCITWWSDLYARSWSYDVWIKPKPGVRGTCYTGLNVKAGYTHTWTDESLTWGLGYPWGIGVGVTETNGSFKVGQGSDGVEDKDLISPKVCQYGP